MKAFDAIDAPVHACYATCACTASSETNLERKVKHTSNLYTFNCGLLLGSLPYTCSSNGWHSNK